MSPVQNILDPVKNVAVIVVYMILLGLVMAAGWFLLNSLFRPTGIFLAFYIILFILGGGLMGAWLWVLIKLPTGISNKYDEIKNRIAAREISTSEDFAYELARFLVDNFSFFRFDLVAVQVVIQEKCKIIYPDNYRNCVDAGYEILEKSRSSEKVINMGRLSLNSRKCHGYILPFWFRGQWLGYALIYSDTCLNIFNLDFLKEFEEHYIDDQLMHVLYYEQAGNNKSRNQMLNKPTDDSPA